MTDKLSAKQRLRIQIRHRVSIENHGYQAQALYWSSTEVQEIRFAKLLEALPKAFFAENGTQKPDQELAQESTPSWSLLDVGCGFADLKHYLNRSGFNPDYTGIDISPDMVRGACAQSLDIKVYEGELSDFDFADNYFDFVILSGALNEVVETELEGSADQQGLYAKSVIRRMYDLCQEGVAFNLLDSDNDWIKSRSDLQGFDKQEMVTYCQGFADRVELIEGYLDNDFTIHLFRSEGAAKCESTVL